jgi:hypothetical protein
MIDAYQQLIKDLLSGHVWPERELGAADGRALWHSHACAACRPTARVVRTRLVDRYPYWRNPGLRGASAV